MPTMEQLLREAVDKNASDLHLSAGQPPRLRVDGDLAPLDHPVMTPRGRDGVRRDRVEHGPEGALSTPSTSSISRVRSPTSGASA